MPGLAIATLVLWCWAIVEKVSGQNYFEYIRDRIYKSAGMSSSGSYELTEVVPNLAIGYGRFEDDPLGISAPSFEYCVSALERRPGQQQDTRPPATFSAFSALRSGKLVSAATREVITSTKTPMTGSYRPGGYGFRFCRPKYFPGKTVFGHGGGGANSGINSNMKTFSDGSYTIIVMGNYDSPAADDLLPRDRAGLLTSRI